MRDNRRYTSERFAEAGQALILDEYEENRTLFPEDTKEVTLSIINSCPRESMVLVMAKVNAIIRSGCR